MSTNPPSYPPKHPPGQRTAIVGAVLGLLAFFAILAPGLNLFLALAGLIVSLTALRQADRHSLTLAKFAVWNGAIATVLAAAMTAYIWVLAN
ncbi:hypothetical protein JT358_11300 [Micrococcales bacterium 31B]|nr:hypothetical protein [Micrococcales bacterium 31B]